MDDPICGAQATLHHVSASPHRRPRAGTHNTRDGTFANPGIALNLAHRETGIVQFTKAFGLKITPGFQGGSLLLIVLQLLLQLRLLFSRND